MTLHLESLELPLTIRPAARLSDDELEAFSRRNEPYQVEENQYGELIIMLPLGGVGGTQELYVSTQLGRWAEEDGSGVAFGPNTGFRLNDGSCLAPDGAWASASRWQGLTREQRTGFPPLCPDFLMEVRSKSDPLRTLEAKMLTWIENGARLAWLIDPVNGTVAIYRPGEPVETLERPDVVIGHAPVEGFQLKTTRLWDEV